MTLQRQISFWVLCLAGMVPVSLTRFPAFSCRLSQR